MSIKRFLVYILSIFLFLSSLLPGISNPVLASSDTTTYPLVTGTVSISPSYSVYSSYKFTLPEDIPAGKQCRVVFEARTDSPTPSGSTFALWLVVKAANGLKTSPKVTDLLNKDPDYTTTDGREASWYYDEWTATLYSPDFDAVKAREYIPDPFAEPYRTVYDITTRVNQGENEIQIYNYTPFPNNLIIKDMYIEVGDPLPPPLGLAAPAPIGALDTYVAKIPTNPVMAVSLNSLGEINIKMNGNDFKSNSRLSNPGAGQWGNTSDSGTWSGIAQSQTKNAIWHGVDYKVDRTVKNCGDHLEVDDIITNTGDSLLGKIYENRISLPDELGTPEYTVGGFKRTSIKSPGNPTSIAVFANKTAIGMVAEDDVLREQSLNFNEAGVIGLSSNELAIPNGVGTNTRTMEWSIYPTTDGNYWSIINSIRRNFGSNYKIDGPIVYHNEDGTKTAQEYSDWVTKRGVNWLIFGQPIFLNDEVNQYGGPNKTRVANGTGVPFAHTWLSQISTWNAKLKTLKPDVKMTLYMHSQVCTEPATWSDPSLYSDSQMLNSTGTQYTYNIEGVPLREFLSTNTNTYGAALKQTYIDLLADPTLNLDGLYNDEFYWSLNENAFLDANENNWDGCTVQVNTQDHSFLKLYSKSGLVQQSWRLWILDYMKTNEKSIIFNGAAETRSILQKKAFQFCETTSYSDLYTMHLSTPLGYGNHDLSQNDIARSKMTRKILDKGGLIVVRDWKDDPSGQHYLPLMYPITPLEIHEGMIFGTDRTITDRSGIYQMPDGSDMEINVFDGKGLIANDSKDMTAIKTFANGVWSVELRMPSNYLAVLVAKKISVDDTNPTITPTITPTINPTSIITNPTINPDTNPTTADSMNIFFVLLAISTLLAIVLHFFREKISA